MRKSNSNPADTYIRLMEAASLAKAICIAIYGSVENFPKDWGTNLAKYPRLAQWKALRSKAADAGEKLLSEHKGPDKQRELFVHFMIYKGDTLVDKMAAVRLTHIVKPNTETAGLLHIPVEHLGAQQLQAELNLFLDTHRIYV